MPTRAEETQAAVREAMARYEAMVLHERNFDPKTQMYRYPHAISAAEVLRMAGVRSRATLSAGYHDALKRDLDDFVAALKRKTGKGKATREAVEVKQSRMDRVEQLAQTVAALQYKIIALEQENAVLRASAVGTGKIVNLKPSGDGRSHGKLRG